jgi:hypothetical protein
MGSPPNSKPKALRLMGKESIWFSARPWCYSNPASNVPKREQTKCACATSATLTTS